MPYLHTYHLRLHIQPYQVPGFMRNTQVWDRLPDSQVKNVRRSLERTRQVMENVKQGIFPTKK